MIALLWWYAYGGILWGAQSCWYQSRYPLKSTFWTYLLIFFLNALLWPVTMIIGYRKKYF